jgi:hypothetical protein
MKREGEEVGHRNNLYAYMLFLAWLSFMLAGVAFAPR